MKQLGEMTPSLFPSPFLSLLFVPPFPLSRETDNTGRFRFRRYGDVEEQNKRGRRIHLGGKKEMRETKKEGPLLTHTLIRVSNQHNETQLGTCAIR